MFYVEFFIFLHCICFFLPILYGIENKYFIVAIVSNTSASVISILDLDNYFVLHFHVFWVIFSIYCVLAYFEKFCPNVDED